MAKRKVTAENLSSVIRDILEDYHDDITDDMKEVTARVTKEGAQAVKNAALETFAPMRGRGLKKGRYGSGWTSQVETGRFSAQGVIYNSKYPGLPHLLENGHAKRGGGRVAGRPHIKPVEEQIVREYEEKLERAL